MQGCKDRDPGGNLEGQQLQQELPEPGGQGLCGSSTDWQGLAPLLDLAQGLHRPVLHPCANALSIAKQIFIKSCLL